MKTFFSRAVAALLLGTLGLGNSSAGADFAKGADVGWLTEMEAKGAKFSDATGAERDCMRILQDLGMNSIRLRVWVNPANGWNGQDDVVRKAVRAKKLGLRLMIDFHYSDNWADPGKQNKPAAWADHDAKQLCQDIAEHTTQVLQALKSAEVEPEWVQVGNETDNGMLWETGRASAHMDDFAAMITSGYRAVKHVFPKALVVVHISNGFNNDLFRWMFDGLTANHAEFDVIGMSLYPKLEEWQKYDDQCLANMRDMISRYGKPVVIAEVGMDVDHPETAKKFLADIIAKTKSLPDGRGLGVFYWEPESHDWAGYKLGAFDAKGRPTAALDAFR